MAKGSKKELLYLTAGFLALQIPFADQAFHIDDNIYLLLSENIGNRGLFPQDLSTYFEGLRVNDFFPHEHPLLLSSLLLYPALQAASQWSETVAHAIFGLFGLAMILATYFVAFRITRLAWAAALLTALSPVVLLSGHTVMLDLPFAALLYVALALALYGTKPAAGLLAGLSVTGAVMLAYQAAFFLPAVYCSSGRNLARGRYWIWLLPTLALAAYAVINSIYIGRFIWWDLFEFWNEQPSTGWVRKFGHSGFTLLAAIVFPGAWFLLLKRRIRPGPANGSDTTEWPARAAQSPGPGVTQARVALWMFVGITILLFLAVYQVSAVRYWLPAVPAFCILLVSAIERRFVNAKPVIAALLMGTAAVSIPMAVADYQWAGFYREAARVAEQYHVQGARVWFTAEWGFRWYLSRAGGQPLGREDCRPQRGDILIRPRIASPYITIYDQQDALDLENTIPYRPALPLRLLDFDSNAGFYSCGWGILPFSFSFSDEPLELIAVYRIAQTLDCANIEPTYWDWNR